MRGWVIFALTLALISQQATAKDIVMIFTPLDSKDICANSTLLINTTNDDTGKPITRVQLDFYYGEEKIANTKTDDDGLTTFVPTNTGFYRINAEKSRYRSREFYIKVKACELITTTSTLKPITSTSTTVVPTTSLTCMFDAGCVLCHGKCILDNIAPSDCRLNFSKTCDCRGGACLKATTSITTTTSIKPTTTVVEKPAPTTIEQATPPAVEKDGETKTLLAAAAVLLALIIIALIAVSRVVPAEKTTSLGGQSKKLTPKEGTTKLEQA